MNQQVSSRAQSRELSAMTSISMDQPMSACDGDLHDGAKRPGVEKVKRPELDGPTTAARGTGTLKPKLHESRDLQTGCFCLRLVKASSLI